MYHVIANFQSIEELQTRLREENLTPIVELNQEEREASLEALNAMKESIGYLDENYGEHRHLEHDLGGYGIALLKQEDYEAYYQKILEYHHITDAEPEYEDIVAISPSLVYIRQTFLVSSDYAVVILYTKKVGD